MQTLASCERPLPFESLLLQCDFYYYSFEFLLGRGNSWAGGTVSRFNSHTKIPSELRKARAGYRPVSGACFHCSYCFDSIAGVRQKLGSFSHTELDIPKFRDKQHIIDRFRNGKDLFDRGGGPIHRVNKNQIELPQLLQREPERFMYMLNRSFPNAGFRDA
ncbi:unnamed protein product [Rotaria magnacalcarata]|uniref:Uncharacterized protein n=1 Tax=Rotaria magnacalcarata TaxID=392030 RepID=A0A8S2PG65_9BILA|nr:unnamed protein product [Rotaria magnacalcarata]